MFISLKSVKGFSSGIPLIWISSILHLHSGICHAPKNEGSSSASTADDQLTSLTFIVNDSKLLIASASTFRANVAKLDDYDSLDEDY
jgi:hypothetical protein